MATVEVWDAEAHKKWEEWAQAAQDDVLNQLDPNLIKQLTESQFVMLSDIAILFQEFIESIESNTQGQVG